MSLCFLLVRHMSLCFLLVTCLGKRHVICDLIKTTAPSIAQLCDGSNLAGTMFALPLEGEEGDGLGEAMWDKYQCHYCSASAKHFASLRDHVKQVRHVTQVKQVRHVTKSSR